MDLNSKIKEIEEKLKVTINSCDLLGKGQCNTIYKLQTDDGTFCLKLEKKNKPFPELNHISVEGNILNYFQDKDELKDLVPKLFYTSEHYYIYEYIEGDSMKNSFEILTTEIQVDICKNIANFHYLLTKANKEEVISLGITEYEPKNHKLGLDQHDLGMLSLKNQELIHKAYAIYENSFSSSIPHLLHNDAHDENIFIINNKIKFIDFGDMIWRDVHYDFYNYVVKYPKHWKIIVTEFEKLSNMKLNIDRIVSIALLRYLRSFLERLEDNEEEEEILGKFKYFDQLLSK